MLPPFFLFFFFFSFSISGQPNFLRNHRCRLAAVSGEHHQLQIPSAAGHLLSSVCGSPPFLSPPSFFLSFPPPPFGEKVPCQNQNSTAFRMRRIRASLIPRPSRNFGEGRCSPFSFPSFLFFFPDLKFGGAPHNSNALPSCHDNGLAPEMFAGNARSGHPPLFFPPFFPFFSFPPPLLLLLL